jgi:hypothetical protein
MFRTKRILFILAFLLLALGINLILCKTYFVEKKQNIFINTKNKLKSEYSLYNGLTCPDQFSAFLRCSDFS